MAEPIVLVKANDPEKKPALFACSQCGSVSSPRTYVCREDMAIEAARDAATNCYNCRTHNICKYCGEQCSKHWLACDKCRYEQKLAKAKKIEVDALGDCFVAFDGDTYYFELDEALDAGATLVSPTNFRPYEVDIDRLLETVLDGHHDDASADELVAWDKLVTAIEKFNKAQTSGSYDPDFSKVADLSSIEQRDATSEVSSPDAVTGR